jgi:hypothetical protein
MNDPNETFGRPDQPRSRCTGGDRLMADPLLRREIKKAIDRLPADRLASVADYIAFLSRPTLRQRIDNAERDLEAKKGVSWRAVRDDV